MNKCRVLANAIKHKDRQIKELFQQIKNLRKEKRIYSEQRRMLIRQMWRKFGSNQAVADACGVTREYVRRVVK